MPQTDAPLRIVRVDDRAAEWDRFVAGAPDATICHAAGWREVLSGVLGHDYQMWAAVDANGWRGVLPLVRVRSILGHYLISVPFLNDGGPLGDEAARLALADHALAEARRSGADVLELRSRIAVPGELAPSHRKITVMLQLPGTIDELWATTFKAKLRSQIRRPAKEGMVARSGVAEVEPFYEVFARNMRDLGTPVLPRRFFEQTASTFPEQSLFATVYSASGEPVAAGCCLIGRDEMEITWASSLRKYNKFSPNMLLYATVMEEAIRRGVRTFNFGRCTPGGHTHKFKLQWGGVDLPLAWPTWARKGQAGAPSPDKPVFRAATSVWSKLPLSVANRLGPPLARHLP